MRWSPIALPGARTRSWLRLTDGALARLRPDYAPRFETAAATIATAELYWATADMAALAVGAGASLPEVCFARAYRPHPDGMLVWAGGIGQSLDVGGMFDTGAEVATAFGRVPRRLNVHVPFDAVSWAPYGHDGMLLVGWIRWEAIAAALRGQGAEPPGGVMMPPLMPMQAWELPADTTARTVDELRDYIDEPQALTLCLATAAAWALMQQPKLAERSRLDASRDDVRRAVRAGLGDPTVTLVDLRKLYRPQQSEGDSGEPSRMYRHRWVVSGHWRSQPWGPERSLRRPTWIASHTKGPDGAPLLETERVNVWRR